MRVSEARYWRDLRRLDLAVRMLYHEARLGTICTWTSLRPDRVRALARSLEEPRAFEPRLAHPAAQDGAVSTGTRRTAAAPKAMTLSARPADRRAAPPDLPIGPLPSTERPSIIRHRGQSPRQLAYFSRSVRARLDAAALASFLIHFDVIPKDPVPDAARRVPTVPRGLALCKAYDAYCALAPSAEITFEYATLLTVGLAAAEELALAICPDCRVLLVVDPLAKDRDQCLYCTPSLSLTLGKLFQTRTGSPRRAPSAPPGQLPLFPEDIPDARVLEGAP